MELTENKRTGNNTRFNTAKNHLNVKLLCRLKTDTVPYTLILYTLTKMVGHRLRLVSKYRLAF